MFEMQKPTKKCLTCIYWQDECVVPERPKLTPRFGCWGYVRDFVRYPEVELTPDTVKEMG